MGSSVAAREFLPPPTIISTNNTGSGEGGEAPMPIRFLETLPIIRDILPELVNGKTKKSHATG